MGFPREPRVHGKHFTGEPPTASSDQPQVRVNVLEGMSEEVTDYLTEN